MIHICNPTGCCRTSWGLQDGHELLAYEKNFATTRYIEEHALSLLREGRSYKDVAAVTNLSVSTLSRYVRDNGGFLSRKNKCKEDSGR